MTLNESPDTTPLQIRSQPRGPHGVAWATRSPGGKPKRSVIVVAETTEQAEERARKWFEQNREIG
jgi:hypothetical protein